MGKLDAALDLAERGAKIFPLIENSKKPIFEGWPDNASSDPERIRRWWTDPVLQWERSYNIGVTGLLIWDIDVKNGVDGEATLAELTAKHGPIPTSLTVRTPSGGKHIYLRSGNRVRNSAGKLGAGLDVRGYHGYVVGPGSEIDGKKYQIIVDSPIVDAPEWMVLTSMVAPGLARIREPGAIAENVELDAAKDKARTRAFLKEAPKAIQGASGNDTTFRVAVRVGDFGISEPVCLDLMLGEWNEACSPPWAPDELAEVVSHAYRYRGEPLGVDSLDAAFALPPPELDDADAASSGANAVSESERAAWNLKTSRTGVLLMTLSNADAILRKHPAFQGVLAFNEFQQTIFICQSPPWENARGAWTHRPWTDIDTLWAMRWLQSNSGGRMASITLETTRQAVELVASSHQFHPVQNWMNKLSWDGKKRAGSLFSWYFGAEDTPFNAAISLCFLVSMVARTMVPGCKVDTVPTLIGEQGNMKSMALSVLGGEWFRDSAFDMRSKDAFIAIQGCLLYELAELASVNRTEVEGVKAFISSRTDTFRPPYGRSVVHFPRQCVFVATTNQELFLKDSTGNRRFWPILVGKIDLENLERDREQIFAEAVAAYRAGARWWLPRDLEAEATKIQDQHHAVHPWEQIISEHLEVNRFIYAQGVHMNTLLPLVVRDAAQWNRGTVTILGEILNRLGWQSKLCRIQGEQGERVRKYFPKAPPPWV